MEKYLRSSPGLFGGVRIGRPRGWGLLGVLVGAAAVGFATPAGAQQEPPARVTAIVDVTVIPMDHERVLPHQTVLIEGGTITALGPAGKPRVPHGATRVDGRGKYLIPGLSDMHVHLQDADSADTESWLFLFAANGVTTVRDMDYEPVGQGLARSSSANVLRLRARTAAGEVLGPRIYTAGHWGYPFTANSDTLSAAEVARRLAAYKARGYDFVKVHDESPALYPKVVAAARQLGLLVAGHVPNGTPVETVLAAHQRSIEHLTGYIGAIRDPASAPALVAATRAAGVWNCPTLLVAEFFAGALPTDTLLRRWPEVARYARPLELERWRAVASQSDAYVVAASGGLWGPAVAHVIRDYAGWQGTLGGTRLLTRALQQAGAGLLTGTDVGSPVGTLSAWFPGFALHHELEALVRAGLTPYQVLAASTRNAARYFGTLDSTGTVAVGKRADLVLLDGNPLRDITNTQRIAGVMVHGRWLSRTDIDARLATWHPSLLPPR